MVVKLDDRYSAYIGANKTLEIFDRKYHTYAVTLSSTAFEILLENLPKMIDTHDKYIAWLKENNAQQSVNPT